MNSVPPYTALAPAEMTMLFERMDVIRASIPAIVKILMIRCAKRNLN